MKKILIFAFIFLVGCGEKNIMVAEDSYTLSNWRLAMEMRNAQRFELANHYYGIALSSASSEAAIVQLKKEMEDMHRVIRTVR